MIPGGLLGWQVVVIAISGIEHDRQSRGNLPPLITLSNDIQCLVGVVGQHESYNGGEWFTPFSCVFIEETEICQTFTIDRNRPSCPMDTLVTESQLHDTITSIHGC